MVMSRTRTVLKDSGVVWEELEGIYMEGVSLEPCRQAIRIPLEWRRDESSCMQCRTPFQLIPRLGI